MSEQNKPDYEEAISALSMPKPVDSKELSKVIELNAWLAFHLAYTSG